MEDLTNKFKALQNLQAKAQQNLIRVEAKKEEAQKSFNVEAAKLSNFGVSSVKELGEKREVLEKELTESENKLTEEVKEFESAVGE